jgi:hypothetical protein
MWPMSESSSQSPSKERDRNAQAAQPAPIISNLKNIQPALGPTMTQKSSTITDSAEPATRLRGGCCVRYSRGVSIPIIYAHSRNLDADA